METKEFPYLYPYSREEAKRLGQLADWKASHAENVACRKAIERAILLGFDGAHLPKDCAESVIAEFGYHRTAYVLANSLQKKESDGRISRENRDWAKRVFVPDGKNSFAYAAASDSGVLDGFVSQYRRAYQALEQLQGPKQTADDAPEMGGMQMQ